MLRRAWKPVLGTTVLAHPRDYDPSTSRRWDLTAKRQNRSPPPSPSSPRTRSDARLRQHAESHSVMRHGGIVWKSDTAYLPSNDPIEDASNSMLIERDASDTAPPGDYLFFAVMDGTGLASRINDPKASTSDAGLLHKAKSLLSRSSTPYDTNPANVARAIEAAFTKLDAQIVNAPLEILYHSIDQEALKKKLIPDLSNHPLAESSIRTAMSGSCALLALLDTSNRNMYVACTGDSRAVAGVYEETEDGKGVWRVEVLTEDQTGRNPNELKRIQSEHPADEADALSETVVSSVASSPAERSVTPATNGRVRPKRSSTRHSWSRRAKLCALRHRHSRPRHM
ncbi:hypothetical protein NUW54_g9679 [Trametes sanguinea]|uniref:Uncharacterized protein n=1 Tax=Trametes sanguinea TaxID=158606 RepID=A0ACC1P5H6_9APHY|nr:hypothetical protein NUW54_g9679 [Trametes sanguinea]